MAWKGKGPLYEAMMERLKVNDSSQRQRSSTTINRLRSTLEVQEEEASQTFDLSNYDYHKIITTDDYIGVEVNFASHAFLPKSKQLHFGSFDEREAFVTELKQSLKAKRETSYASQVETFLEQQFEKWTACTGQGQEATLKSLFSINKATTVPKDKIATYIRRARIVDRDMNISKMSKAVNFQGWKKVYHRMIKLKTSELLVTVFDNYSIWRGEGLPREMAREQVKEFLQPPGSLGHQNETNVSEDALTNIIQIGLGNNIDATSTDFSAASEENSWKLENFTTWLLSEANDIQDPQELEVHQDMSRPLSHYLVNSSFETFLHRVGVSSKASVKAYEVLLRQGVRFIDMEIWDGEVVNDQLVPCICRKGGLGALTEKLPLDKVLQTIHENAFESSEYPVIISLNIHCNTDNQKATADLFKKILGDNLLTEQVNPDEEELPSPKALKRKIIVMAPEDEEVQKDELDDQDEFFLGNVWFRVTGDADKEWKPKEMIWKKTEEMMSFGSPRHAADIEICGQKYFVGNIREQCMIEFIAGHDEKESGNFLVRSTNNSYDKFALTIYTGKAKQPNGILEVELTHDDSKFFINTEIDSKHKFDSLDSLMSFFQKKKISMQARLTSPMTLKNQQIHRYNDWFYGDLDPETSKEIMKEVKKKGAFLVRVEAGPDGDTFVFDYFDGASHQSMEILQDHDGEVKVPGHDLHKFESITEVVNHLKIVRHANAPFLGEAIQLKGELLADQNDLLVGVETRVRRFSQAHMLDKAGRRFEVDKVRVFAMSTHYKDPNSLNREKSYELSNTSMALETLNSKILEFSHNKKIVIDLGEKKIEITKQDDIELLYEALRSQIKGPAREVSREKTIKPQRIPSQHGQAEELTNLMIYCKSKKGQLSVEQVDTTNAYLRLRSQPDGKALAAFISSKELCGNFQHITSTPDDQLVRQLVPLNSGSYVNYHKSILSHVHPHVSRGNYNPLPFWNSGVQLVSQNLPEMGPMLQINNAMFATNGGCGYVLKPEKQTSCVVSLKILEARHLYSVKTDDFLIPHIQVTVYGTHDRGEVVWDTSKEPRNRNASSNALHTIWDAKFQRDGHVIHNKELAILNFALTEGDDLGSKVIIAQRTVRLANVRNGLRKITLRNEQDNRSFPMAQVLVNIKVFTTDEIEQEDAKLNHAIEAATYEEKVGGLDYDSQQMIKRDKMRAFNMKMKLQKKKVVLQMAEQKQKDVEEKAKKELAKREESRIAFEKHAMTLFQ